MNPNNPLQGPNNQPVTPQPVNNPQLIQPNQPQPYQQVAQPNQFFTAQQPPYPAQTTGPVNFGAPTLAPTPRNNKRIILAITISALVLIAIATGAVLVARGGDSSSPKSSNTTNATAPAVTETPLPDSSTPAEAVSAPVVTNLERKISTDFGYGVTANELVTGFIPENPGDEFDVIILKLSITQDSQPQYTGTSPYPNEFVLIVDGQEVTQSQNYTGASKNDYAEAGYPGLLVEAAKADKPNIGYIYFGVEKGKKPTAVRLKQKEATILGSTNKLPAKNYDIAL